MLIKIKQLAGLEQYVKQMVDRKASDFFLIPGEPPAYRVKGEIVRTEVDPLTQGDLARLTTNLFGKRQLKRLGKELGILRGTFSTEKILGPDAGSPQRVVIAVARSNQGYTLAGQTVPGQIPSAEEIKIPPAVLRAAESASGLVIISGPTGSGKSTAAMSILDHLNARCNGHICVIGDPIEYHLEPKQCIIQHRTIGVEVPDMVAGIHSALAQDLDVLFVSEIRTLDELSLCLSVAQAGHMVITVLHARTVETAIQRVGDVFSPDGRRSALDDLAGALRCLVAMRLMPKASGEGGRVAAYEVLLPDAQVRKAIRNGENVFDRETPMPEGCQTFEDSIAALLADGSISEETANHVREAL